MKIVVPGLLALQNPVSNWMYETVPQPGLNGRRGYQPRGKGLGGSSAINAMAYIRGNAWDYDNWAAQGCPGWTWDDVLPWFKRSEGNVRGADDFHGGDGPLTVSELQQPHAGSHEFIAAAESIQIPRNDDFNGPRQEGVGFYQVTQKDGERWSAARAYLDHARERANLHVLTDANADRILFDEGKAWGVAYTRDGEQRVIRARQGVVLAAGVFGTPQLLMLSGIGPGKHLRDFGLPVRLDRPAVGSNLQDHVDYVAAFETKGGYFMGKTLRHAFRTAGSLARWLTSRTGALTTNYAESGAFLRVMPDAQIPDVQLHFVPAPLEDHGRGDVKSAGYSCHVCVLRPESHGTVRLASLDPRAAPLIDPAFLADPPRHGGDEGRRARDVPHPRTATARPAPRQGPQSARPGQRRRARTPDPRPRRHRLSPGRHRPDGQRRRRGLRSQAQGARRGGAVGGRRQHHAQADQRQHQRARIMIGERCADFVAAELG